jgi:hypothetical protein
MALSRREGAMSSELERDAQHYQASDLADRLLQLL